MLLLPTTLSAFQRVLFVGVLSWALAFPLLWQLATASVVGVQRPATAGAQLAHSLLFMAGCLVFLRPAGWGTSGPAWARTAAANACLAAIPLALCAYSLSPYIARYPTLFSLLVLGATVEEVVFRFLLPRKCSSILALRFPGGWARLAGFAAAQAVFAASHGVVSLVGPGSAPSGLELMRLGASGLLLQAVQVLFGTGAAIGAHAVVNTALVLGTYEPSAPPGPGTVIPLLFSGLLLVWAADHHARRGRAASLFPLHQ